MTIALEKKKEIISNLSKNTEVLESLFEAKGLKVLSIGFAVVDKFGIERQQHGIVTDYYYNGLKVLIEIMPTDANRGKQNVGKHYFVVCNLYDENGILIGSESDSLHVKSFNTLEINFGRKIEHENIVLTTCKVRIAIKEW